MRLATFLTTVTLALLGTIGLAQNVTYDVDPLTDFSRFRTYAWVPGTVVRDELAHRRIVRALDAQLAAKGMVMTDNRLRADVLVAYHASFDRDLQISGFSSGWGGYRFGGTRTATARAEEILVGTLVVDVVNPHTKTIVWRGMATRDIDVQASPEKREKNINRTAERLLRNYPSSR